MSDGESNLSIWNLTALSDQQMAFLTGLRVSERQEFLGGSFIESLEAWHDAPKDQMLGYGFLFGDQPVGMVLFRRPPLSPSWAGADAATIHGLKIASGWQGRGWGHLAFRLAVQRLKIDWPEAKTLMLAADADNIPALAVYRAFGMADSGPVFDGNHGREHRLELQLVS